MGERAFMQPEDGILAEPDRLSTTCRQAGSRAGFEQDGRQFGPAGHVGPTSWVMRSRSSATSASARTRATSSSSSPRTA